jgi:hypothetical protein
MATLVDQVITCAGYIIQINALTIGSIALCTDSLLHANLPVIDRRCVEHVFKNTLFFFPAVLAGITVAHVGRPFRVKAPSHCTRLLVLIGVADGKDALPAQK